jgi:hypothetical protein
MWHGKEPSLLKAMGAKHRSKFAALSPLMVTAAGLLKICSGSYKQTNKQTNVFDLCLVREKYPPFLSFLIHVQSYVMFNVYAG